MVSSEYWFGARGFYNGVATQSLRFDSGSSAYLYRTPSSAGNRRTFTWSAWLKRGVLDADNTTGSNDTSIFSGGSGSTGYSVFRFFSQVTANSNYLALYTYLVSSGVDYSEETDTSYRDISSWYHFVISVDTTQSTASNRIRYYVNGTEITDKSQYYGQVPQDYDFHINNNVLQGIGRNIENTRYFDGYMAEVNFVDGTQYDASYFGETKNGVWIAKEPSVTYGTNGYRLQFKQTGTGTASASTIGADTSGNTNHWTSSGIVASDCNMPDSPENGFATLNSISEVAPTLSEGNLAWSMAQATPPTSTFSIPSTGKWYWEVRPSAIGEMMIGVQTRANLAYSGRKTIYYKDGGSGGGSGSIYIEGSGYGGDQSAYTNGDIIAVLYNADDMEISWRKNNTQQGLTFDVTDTDVTPIIHHGSGSGTNSGTFNFGQDSTFGGAISAGGNADENGIGDFAYAPPSGFLALCSDNLPEPIISPNADTQADDYFNTVLYTGSGSSQSITGVGFQPDWTWVKNLSISMSHGLTDSARGVGITLKSDSSNEEIDYTSLFTSFDSDGFTVVSGGVYNNSGNTYVSWNWKANGTTPTKTYKVKVVSDSTDYGHGTGSNKYQFFKSDGTTGYGTNGVDLDLQEGGTYTFDWSDSSAQSHPIRFSLTNDGTHSSGTSAGTEYTTGVVKDDSAYTTTITVASGVANLYYYCQNHSGMGAEIRTNTTHGSTNFDGSILSVVQRNTTAGFSIVTYTGTGSNATVAHGLGATPDMVIYKIRDTGTSWAVWHKDLATPTTGLLELNSDGAELNSASYWNSTIPTSTVLSIGTYGGVNASSPFIAYCFAGIEGYSKFGSYIANQNDDGTFVYLGFKPAFVMVKNITTSSRNWTMIDDTRFGVGTTNQINPVISHLKANDPDAEFDSISYPLIDILSNGFKVRLGTQDAGLSRNMNRNSGDTVIYMAFASVPFKYANAK
tara:strand:+ start:153 stop:3029 length:2877 start_codon:yes stop_codon:yes gene_type:complete